MKIAIFSDLHLGFDENGERSSESFESAKKAFEIALKEKTDVILLAGDLFDAGVPSQETLLKAFELFSKAKKENGKICLKKSKENSSEETECNFIPIISIHGTHEFRGKDFANVLQLLEKAGFIHYLHANCIEIEKGKEKLFVHGMGGVPEKKALDALKLYNPTPQNGGRNILLLHQSIKEYLPFEDEMIASISLADLPTGFDLIVNGHLHWNAFEELGEKRLLLTGSTIITQMKKLESEKPKCVAFYDSKNDSFYFMDLPSQRKLFYEKIKFENAMPDEIKAKAEQILSQILEKNSFNQKPLIRLKLIGSLAKGISSSDVPLNLLEKKFKEKAILSIDKDFSITEFREKLHELRKLQQSKKSITALGIGILEKNLSETNFNNAFDIERVFELLANDKIDDALFEISQKKEQN